MGQKTMFRAAAHAIGGWQQTWSRFTVRPVRPGVVLAALLWATCAISAEGAKAPNLERRAVAVESAASAVAPRPTIAFKLATEEFPSGNVQLSNGKEVTVSDWPTIVVARIAPGSLSSSASKASCTAVLVGPKVILTAAHCVDDPLSGKFRPRKRPRERDRNGKREQHGAPRHTEAGRQYLHFLGRQHRAHHVAGHPPAQGRYCREKVTISRGRRRLAFCDGTCFMRPCPQAPSH